MAEQIWSIQQCRLFEKLPGDDLQFLEQRSRVKSFARNSAIYLPQDMAESVLVVVSGRIRLYSITPDGKEILLAFVEPGELFGELALTGSEIREEFAQAAAQSMVVAIPRDAMESVLLRNAGLSLSITRYVGSWRK